MGKDGAWKPYFDDNQRYADLINGVGCDGKQIVKADDLQEADSNAKDKSRDLLRKIAFGTNFAIVGIENQEEMDYEIPFRVMHYDVSSYQKQISAIGKEVRANPEGLEAGEYMYGFRKESRLNPLITFILYGGRAPWDGATSLHGILDFTNMPEELKDKVPDYKINVIDIRRFENTDVFQTDVKQVFDFIRYSEDKNKLLELVESDEYYSVMEEDAFDLVTKYTNSKELVQVKEYKLEGGKQNVCKAIRDLMDDSREEGKDLGRSEGRELGIKQTKLENAKNLLDILEDEVIAEKIGLPIGKVKELRSSIYG